MLCWYYVQLYSFARLTTKYLSNIYLDSIFGLVTISLGLVTISCSTLGTSSWWFSTGASSCSATMLVCCNSTLTTCSSLIWSCAFKQTGSAFMLEFSWLTWQDSALSISCSSLSSFKASEIAFVAAWKFECWLTNGARLNRIPPSWPSGFSSIKTCWKTVFLLISSLFLNPD